MRHLWWILLFCLSYGWAQEKPPVFSLVVTYGVSSLEDMARLSSYLQNRQSKYFLVDLGRSWGNYLHLANGKQHFTLLGMNLLRYHLAVPNLSDERFPKKYWREATFQWLLTNGKSQAGQFYFLPYRIYQFQNITFSFLASTDPSIGKTPFFASLYPHLQIQEEGKELAPFVTALSKQSDVLILLSLSKPSKNIYLATRFPSLRLIFGVEAQEKKPYRQKLGKTHLLWFPKQGSWIWEVQFYSKDSFSFHFSSLKKWKQNQSFWKNLKAQQREISKKLKKRFVWKAPPPTNFQIWAAKKFCQLLDLKKFDVVLLYLPPRPSWSPKVFATKELFSVFPLPNRAFELLVSGKTLQKIWNSPLRYKIFIYGLEEKTAQGKPILYVKGKPLQEEKIYHIFFCSGGESRLLKDLAQVKVIQVLEKDFFHDFVREMEKREFIKPWKGENP